jgi:hypothetical protein
MKIYREAVGKEWRDWFAWRPVRTESFEWVWLETVQRKIFNCPIPNVIPSSWVIYKRTESREDK